MTLISQDGMDSYNVPADLSTKYGSVGASVTIDTTGGRYGEGCISSGGFSSSVVETMPTAQGELWTGFAISNTDTAYKAVAGIFSVLGANDAEVVLYYSPISGIFTFQTTSGTVIASGIGSLGTGVYHWLEIRSIIGVSGVLELWLDNVRKINFIGPTNPHGGTNIAAISIAGGGKNDSLIAKFDDKYILNTLGTRNNARKGDGRIETVYAISDFGPNDGTPLTGDDHFAMVDEVYIDYATSTISLPNTVGKKEVFAFNPMSDTPNNIWALRVVSVVEKSDGSTCNGAAYVNSSSTIGIGPTVPILTTWSDVEGIFETDPNTSAPWTEAAINAVKAGIEIVA